jgi:4-hydroxybenzoate polyprenyltransferase
MLFGLPITWLGPILDILISRGNGYTLTYNLSSNFQILIDFFKFFSPAFKYGATYGVRIEIIILVLGLGYVTWQNTKNIWKGLLASFLSYTLIFIIATLPGILYTIANPHDFYNQTQVSQYISELIQNSNIAHNSLHDFVITKTYPRSLELGFDKLMTQLLLVISILFLTILFYNLDGKKLKIVFKNARWERLFFYESLLLIGLILALYLGVGEINRWVDILGIICLILSVMGLWMFSVQTNDIADINIDKITNLDRPLVKGELTSNDMKEIGYIWLTLALTSAWAAGYYPFFMTSVGVALSYIYSVEPLRLKKYPFISTFILGIASLTVVLSGFFFLSIDKNIAIFPSMTALLIIFGITLAFNFKDIKDIEGDKNDNIITLPVLFPRFGMQIIGMCLAVSFLLIPIAVSFYTLYIFAIPAAFIGYFVITQDNYKERNVFILYFAFILAATLLVLLLYWIKNSYNLI